MTLYEINIRVFRHRFGPATQLLDIPVSFWQGLAQQGTDWVWLMGVWQTPPPAVILPYATVPELREVYNRVLPDWTDADVIGSPYAIDDYVLHTELGEVADLQRLRTRLNSLGLRLMLDFVPNHFHAESSLLTRYPDVFLEVPAAFAENDPTYYSHPLRTDRKLAHGKDPYFPAWLDTVQVDYSTQVARSFMSERLLMVAEVCDGVRCDMAMLPVNGVFQRTWHTALGDRGMPDTEFWPQAIETVKARYPAFRFMAEVYWDMEWALQQQGFDYTYDKRLLDRLLTEDTPAIRLHLRADPAFQAKSVRFLENHDEQPILHQMTSRQAQAAAVLVYLQTGLRFFHNGQWEGRRQHLPVQLGRMPQEHICVCAVGADSCKVITDTIYQPVCTCTWRFYEKLLALLQQSLFTTGVRTEIEASSESLFIYHWHEGDRQAYVLVNYGATTVPVSLDFLPPAREWFSDVLWTQAPRHFYPFQYAVLFC